MTRREIFDRIDAERDWEVLIVGGGATGLGAGVEAASRGYRTLVLEAGDFGCGTSSRSTKLVHGGVRYLQQGNVALVLDALHERGLLLRNAPHLVGNQSFIVPIYDWWEGPFYGVGLKLYDMLAGDLGFGPSQLLSRSETIAAIPTVETKGLLGGVSYHDGQFDDARLAVTLALSCVDHGGVVLNHATVVALLKEQGHIVGVRLRDNESGTEREIRAQAVINATGPFCDNVRRLDDPGVKPLIAPSQGVHLVLPKEFLPGDSAIMVPHTDDGRVLFAVPWHDRVIVGTTDTPVATVESEPRPQAEEIAFLLEHAARYLSRDPKESDILSIFAGVRPLVKHGDDHDTASLSRDHTLLISPAGLVTITGGKWTTYRKMGEDTITAAARLAGLKRQPSHTAELKLHGATTAPHPRWAVYGSDAEKIERLCHADPGLREPLHPRLPYCVVEVVWGARYEWARSVEDILSRRTRALLLDARAASDCAPRVAELLAAELGHDQAWQEEQVEKFTLLARRYLP